MVNIVSDQIGGPTYALDLAIFIKQVIQTQLNNNSWNNNIIHFAGYPYVSWFEFGKYIYKVGQLNKYIHNKVIINPIPSLEFNLLAERPKNSCLDCSFASREYGIKGSNWKKAVRLILDKHDS